MSEWMDGMRYGKQNDSTTKTGWTIGYTPRQAAELARQKGAKVDKKRAIELITEGRIPKKIDFLLESI